MMLKVKNLCAKIDLILISFRIFFIFMFYLYKSVKCVYAHNKNICIKLRNICFAIFIDSLKITLQVIKFTSQFAKCEGRIRTLPLQLKVKRFVSWLWANDITTSWGRVPNGTLSMMFAYFPNLMFQTFLWLEIYRFSNWSCCWLWAVQSW